MDSKSARRSRARIEVMMYLVGFWLWWRAAIPLLLLVGEYRAHPAYLTISGTAAAGSFPHWLLAFNPMALVTIVISLAFLACCIGLSMGKRWARLGVLVTSAIVVLWNLRAASANDRAPLYSLVAFGLTYWFFRQPGVLSYFGATDHSPSFLDRRILNMPLDLGFSMALLVALIVFEIYIRLAAIK